MKKQTYLLFLLPFLILAACSSEASQSVENIEEQAEQELDAEIYIPEFEEYPMVSAEIFSVPMASSKSLMVTYSREKDSLKSDELISNHEETVGSEVIYGIYEGDPILFKITFDKNEIISGDGSHELRTVSGESVLYHETTSGDNEYLTAFFNGEQGSYSFEFALTDELTEDEAYWVISTVIQGQKSK
ncbi:hypothetical protein [Planococcus halotolerans]|uniref:hypothetical protein n=1 Tax=Planococcus halotolerans TaxID=2233542 RepID=UPI001092D288|nr:hypothetical protein [Planococcus halotolerans]QHJ69947.1 hypothetical protein DNR44_004735 [Planococcus halotolerans]